MAQRRDKAQCRDKAYLVSTPTPIYPNTIATIIKKKYWVQSKNPFF